VEAGDQDPEEAQQSQDKERVVEPERAACINSHQNACSDEHLFERKARGQYKRITTPIVCVAATLWLTAGCLPDPQRLQSVALFDQLVAARATLSAQPLQAQPACTTVGDVQTRLTGEPGLADVRPAWPALHQAAQALQAVCGQDMLLSQPTTDSMAISQARERWQQGIQREIGVACDHLREAATALDRAQPC
jgi:hypothetical protein